MKANTSTRIHDLLTEEETYEQQDTRRGQLNFSDPHKREAHLQAFLAWLPTILHEAPGMDWASLPSKVMGYLIRNVADSPDAIPITFAIGCAMNGMKHHTLRGYCGHLATLLRQLRTKHGMGEFAQLATRQLWERFVTGRTLSHTDVRQLVTYESLASLHVRTYLEGLNMRQRTIWEHYAHEIRNEMKASRQ